MRTAIVGCGAMGTVLGAYLYRGNFPVDMFDNNEAQIKALNEKGATVVNKANFNVPVHAFHIDEMEGSYDLIFLMTKQLANEAVLPKLLPHMNDNSIICTLQNGVPEPFVARYVGDERVCGGTMHWGATFIEPGVSELTTDVDLKKSIGAKLFDLGEYKKDGSDRLERIVKVLSLMGEARPCPNLMDARWIKLVVNAAGSGMSAACGVPFGPLLDSERAMKCMSYVAYEVAFVAEKAGFNIGEKFFKTLLDPEKGRGFFNKIYSSSREGKASMLQDLEAGRLTEADMLDGYVSDVAKSVGLSAPYNEAVRQIVHRIEKKELPLSMDNLKYFPDFDYEAREYVNRFD